MGLKTGPVEIIFKLWGFLRALKGDLPGSLKPNCLWTFWEMPCSQKHQSWTEHTMHWGRDRRGRTALAYASVFSPLAREGEGARNQIFVSRCWFLQNYFTKVCRLEIIIPPVISDHQTGFMRNPNFFTNIRFKCVSFSSLSYQS